MPITLVEGGEAVGTIRYVGGGEPVAAFAADELQSYVSSMSGATLPIEEASADTVGDLPANVASAVVVALDGDDSPTSRLKSAADRLDGASDDAYVVRAGDGGGASDGGGAEDARNAGDDGGAGAAVVLAGTTHRGTLYAAYDLLERLGVDFFAPAFEFYGGHHEHVPEKETVTVQNLDVVESPDLEYRRKHVEGGWSVTPSTLSALVDWLPKTRHNVLVCPADYSNWGSGAVTWDGYRDAVVPELEKRGLLLEVGGHGFDSFLQPGEYEDDHPEWFVDGHNVFDVTEDAAVEAYVEEVIAYLDDRPEIDIFDAWPPDGASWPPVVEETFDSLADAYARVVNELADAVGEAFPDRDVTVEAIAYASHLDPPSTEYACDDGALIDFAPIGRGYAAPIDDEGTDANRRYADLLEDWRESFDGPLVAYEYYRRYAWHSLPVVMPGIVAEDLRYYREVGVRGVGSYAEPGDWVPFELTHLVAGALAWDTELDAGEWLDDYLAARYGEVAGLAAEYVDLVEEAGRIRFPPGRGETDDEAAMADVRDLYRDARAAIGEARNRAGSGSAAEHVCGLLEANAEYAVVDTEVSLHDLRGDDEAADAARTRLRELATEHAFDGIVLDGRWTLRRTDPDFETAAALTDAERELFDRYRERWGN